MDLRWHSRKQFMALSQDQKDELTEWLGTDAGKKNKKEYFDSHTKNGKRKGGEPNNAKWKKQFKKKLKTHKGVASVMAILGKEEEKNAARVAALTQISAPAATTAPAPAQPPAPAPTQAPAPVSAAAVIAPTTATATAFPATSTRMTSILRTRRP